MSLVINEDNLKINDIQKHKSKVRAILVDENNNILVANYGGIFLLPGGSIGDDEKIGEAIIRELKEETGVDYSLNEFEFLNTVEHYQKGYHTRDGNIQNRIVMTYYFVGDYKEILKDNQDLTDNEKKSNFKLELIPIEELEEILLSKQNDNPRNKFFTKELLVILENYKKNFGPVARKKIL